MFDYDVLTEALDELGFEGVRHVSRYVMDAQGEPDAGPFDEAYARECLASLTPEQRMSVVAYFGALLVRGGVPEEVGCS